MTQDRWEDKLSPWLDGELPAGEARGMQEHLASCSGCRARLDGMRRISESIRRLDRIPMPADLKTDLTREARGVDLSSDAGRPRRADRVMRARPWALASLGAAALVIAVVMTVPPASLRREPAERLTIPTIDEDRKVGPVSPPGFVAQSSEDDAAPRKDRPIASPEGALRKQKMPAAAPRPAPAARPADAADAMDVVEAPSATSPEENQVTISSGTHLRELGYIEPGASGAAAPPPAPTPVPDFARQNLASSPPGARGGGLARFTTEMIRPGKDPASLAPIVPAGPRSFEPPAAVMEESITTAAEKKSPARAAEPRRGPAPAPSGKEAGLTTKGSEATGLDAAVPSLVFLVRLDPGGRILSAEALGARAVEAEVVELARSLLMSASIAPHEPSHPSLVVVEVRLPSPAP